MNNRHYSYLQWGVISAVIAISLTPNASAVLPSVMDAPAELLVDIEPADDITQPNLNLAPEPSETAEHTPLHQLENEGAIDPLAKFNLSQDKAASASPPKATSSPIAKEVKDTPHPKNNKKDNKKKTDKNDEPIIALASESKPVDEQLQSTLTSLRPEMQADLEALTKVLHQEHKAVAEELKDEEALALTDLALLWQAAVERSGTIRFAIEKLSRQDATGQPTNGTGFTKRMVQSMARLGGVAGSLWTGTPAGVIGGNVVEQLIKEDPSSSSIMSRVTDADMLILAKEVEELQSNVIQQYYTYKHSQEQWKLAQKAKRELAGFYDALDTKAIENQAMKPILESLFNGINQDEQRYRQEFVSARNGLSLLVGADAILTLEKTKDLTAQK